ncbi:MAG: amino acid permease [candidate division KSB1 bacterium]|nr:amino acid permease [candidate division KSB1 bacterium]MDZ7302850.1 amino acid permease [candidate division KSB1 bacterium]MDZ7311867.1 amino acid permease [candidate division KSB1 bacterium]
MEAFPSLARNDEQTPGLRRELTLLDSIMINVGTIIGSAIFIVPATVALHVQSSTLAVMAWVAGGIVSLLGALSVAELGAAMPHAGGQYVYLREAYGPMWGFLYGWTAFAVISSASIAAIAIGFAQYLGYFVQLNVFGIKAIAILSIIFLTTINCFGLKFGAWTQNTFTFAKIAALVALFTLGFILPAGSSKNFLPLLPAQSWLSLLGPFGLAMVEVLWAYDGWIEITYVAGEVKNPQRHLAAAIIFSTAIVIAIYILINFAYIHVLSVPRMAHSQLVASEAATTMMGKSGAVLITLAILISMFGANNGIIFTSARIPYAMAKERLFFHALSHVHVKWRTPVTALVIQGMWACLLALTGTYRQLITYVIFASWIFYAMSCGAVILLRRKAPYLTRPYKTWGYPFTPLVFIFVALWLVINTIIHDPRDAAIGAGLIVLGLPAYFYWKA